MFAVLVSVIFIPHLSVFYLFSPFSFFPISLSRSKVSDPDKHTQFSPVTSQILPASLPSCSQSKHSFSSLKLNLTSLPYRLQSETFFSRRLSAQASFRCNCKRAISFISTSKWNVFYSRQGQQ